MCGRRDITQWRYILVDKGAMAVREIQLSERDSRHISLPRKDVTAHRFRVTQILAGRARHSCIHQCNYAAKVSWCNNLRLHCSMRKRLNGNSSSESFCASLRHWSVIAIPKFNYNGKGTNRYGRYVYNRLRLSTAKFNQCSLILSNICTQSHPRTSQFCPTVSRY